MAADQAVTIDRVLLIGASGQIGIFCIPMLVARGFSVIALSRRPRPPWYPEFPGVTWITPVEFAKCKTDNVTVLLSAGPAALAVKYAEHLPALRRMVVFSSTSVQAKRRTRDPHEQSQIAALEQAEQSLRSLCVREAIDLALFRPTLVYGCGLDTNISRIARWIRRLGFLALPSNAQGRRQPVHAEDLARIAAQAMTADIPSVFESAIPGGSVMTYEEMVRKVFHGLDRPVRILRLPRWLLTGVATVTCRLPGRWRISPEIIRRQSADQVFVAEALSCGIDFSTRIFAPGEDDFRLPDREYLSRLAAPPSA